MAEQDLRHTEQGLTLNHNLQRVSPISGGAVSPVPSDGDASSSSAGSSHGLDSQRSSFSAASTELAEKVEGAVMGNGKDRDGKIEIVKGGKGDRVSQASTASLSLSCSSNSGSDHGGHSDDDSHGKGSTSPVLTPAPVVKGVTTSTNGPHSARSLRGGKKHRGRAT